MSIFNTVLLFLIGLLLIVKGGDYFVDAASFIAKVSGIPKFIIGATIVSIATTLPELIVSVIAAIAGKNDMATSNAVGSVMSNTGLIMGLSIVCMPVAVKRMQFNIKGILMVLSAAFLLILSYQGIVSTAASVGLIAIFIVFVFENIKITKASFQNSNCEAFENVNQKAIFINVIKFVFGSLSIILGAKLLVDKGSDIARILGISESIIAVSVIAIGTSLPELVTTLSAIVKNQSSLSIGNIIGANIIDLTLILPICSIISGGAIPVSKQTALFSLPICLGIILIGVIPTLIKGKFYRLQGITMISAYIIFIAALSLKIM